MTRTGWDIPALFALKDEGKSVVDYPRGEKLERDGVIDISCDIWIPAARPDVVHEDNVHRLRTKLVAQGANIPFTYGAERYLHEHGVLCIPDFIANAGGVICAAVEYHGASQTAAFQTIEERLCKNTAQVLHEAASKRMLPRDAAVNCAIRHIKDAMRLRRWSIF